MIVSQFVQDESRFRWCQSTFGRKATGQAPDWRVCLCSTDFVGGAGRDIDDFEVVLVRRVIGVADFFLYKGSRRKNFTPILLPVSCAKDASAGGRPPLVEISHRDADGEPRWSWSRRRQAVEDYLFIFDEFCCSPLQKLLERLFSHLGDFVGDDAVEQTLGGFQAVFCRGRKKSLCGRHRRG